MARSETGADLRYVWTNRRVDVESIVDSPYLPGIVKSIVVERSGSKKAEWLVETRNILKDFERAFGHAPKEAIEAIALFTDNDQTKEPVIAYCEWARVECAHEVEPPLVEKRLEPQHVDVRHRRVVRPRASGSSIRHPTMTISCPVSHALIAWYM